MESDSDEDRVGNNAGHFFFHGSGRQESAEVTLRKGSFSDEPALFDYFAGIQTGNLEQQTVAIRLQDEAGSSLMSWTLEDVLPKRVSLSEWNSQTGVAVIDEVVLTHEGITTTSV